MCKDMPAVSRESDWNAAAPRGAYTILYSITSLLYMIYVYDICNLLSLTRTSKLFFLIPPAPDLQLALPHLEFWKVHFRNEQHALET